MPVGFILARELGFARLVEMLRLPVEKYEAGKQIERNSKQLIIRFADEKWVFDKSIMSTRDKLIISGMNYYARYLKQYSALDFDTKEVYGAILHEDGVAVRYERELDLIQDLFIDDSSREMLEYMKEPTEITGLRYVPRASDSNGNLRDVKLVVTDESGKEHTFTVTDWPNNNKPKDIDFGKTIKAKKIVLTGTKTYGDGGDKYQSAAELIFTRPQVAETPLDMSGYEAALAKAQKLTDKDNQEEVASVQASMKYATDNHLLTERMVAYFADYLNQLQDKVAKPDAPTSSKGEEQPPVLEVPEFFLQWFPWSPSDKPQPFLPDPSDGHGQ